jgi:hypothetical protein
VPIILASEPAFRSTVSYGLRGSVENFASDQRTGPCAYYNATLRVTLADRTATCSSASESTQWDVTRLRSLLGEVQDGFVPLTRQIEGYKSYSLLDGGPDVL